MSICEHGWDTGETYREKCPECYSDSSQNGQRNSLTKKEVRALLDEISGLPRYKVNSVGVGPDTGTAISTWQDDNGKWVSAVELETILIKWETQFLKEN